LLDRLGSDSQFVERLKANPQEALGEFDLSPTEQVALTTNDEDGLRRLAGLDVSGYAILHYSVGACLGVLSPTLGQATCEIGCGGIIVVGPAG